jgi:hypothetical protein
MSHKNPRPIRQRTIQQAVIEDGFADVCVHSGKRVVQEHHVRFGIRRSRKGNSCLLTTCITETRLKRCLRTRGRFRLTTKVDTLLSNLSLVAFRKVLNVPLQVARSNDSMVPLRIKFLSKQDVLSQCRILYPGVLRGISNRASKFDLRNTVSANFTSGGRV